MASVAMGLPLAEDGTRPADGTCLGQFQARPNAAALNSPAFPAVATRRATSAPHAPDSPSAPAHQPQATPLLDAATRLLARPADNAGGARPRRPAGGGHPRHPARLGAGGRAAHLCGRPAGTAFPRLGNAALRHLQPAPGDRLPAHRHALSAAVGTARRAGGAHCHADAAHRPALAHHRLGPDARQGPEARPRRRATPAGSGRLPPRAAGGRAGRLRRARRADRHLPDGYGRALSRRTVRRRDRLDPQLRSGNPALAAARGESRAAARARVPAHRGGGKGLSHRLARALSHRRAPLPALPGHEGRRHAGWPRVLPAAVLQESAGGRARSCEGIAYRNRHAVRLPGRRRTVRAGRGRRRGVRAFLDEHRRAL